MTQETQNTDSTAAQDPRSKTKKRIQTACILFLLAAAVFGGMVWYKEFGTKSFIVHRNNTAHNLYNTLNTIILDAEEQGHTREIPSGNYIAYGKIDGDTLTFEPEDASFSR